MRYTFLNEVVFGVIEATIILFLFSILISQKQFILRNKIKACLFVSLYSIFSYWASTYIPMGYHTILIAIFMVISLALITYSSLIGSLLACLLIMVFFVATEFVFCTIFLMFMRVNVADILNAPLLKFYLTVFVKSFEILIVILLYFSKKMDRFILKKLSAKSPSFIGHYIFLGIFIMGNFVFSINYGVSNKENLILYEVLLFLLFLFFALLGVLAFKEKENLLQIHHQYQLQKEYIKNIETVIDIIRREKHDFVNHINTVYAICMLNKPDATERIKAYLDKLIDNLQSAYHFYNTGNDYIDGLLAVKSNSAFNNNIHMEVFFEELLDQIEMDDQDLISILGNLIDNAFDSILSAPEYGGNIVSVYGYIEDDKYYLSVSDNGPMIPKEVMDRIFEKGFSTKKEQKGEHGFGLYIIRRLIEKNGGKITVSSYEEETEFLIECKRKVEYGEIGTEDYKFDTAKPSEI